MIFECYIFKMYLFSVNVNINFNVSTTQMCVCSVCVSCIGVSTCMHMEQIAYKLYTPSVAFLTAAACKYTKTPGV